MTFIINILYNLSIFLVQGILPILAIFNGKVKHYLLGQKDLKNKLKEILEWKLKNPSKEIVWFHCASLGEFEQGRPVIESYKSNFPDCGIVITFFSPSGYEIRKNYSIANFVLYLPLDSNSMTRRFVITLNPKIAVFVKYEFWPNIIKALKRNKTKLVGISVILRENQIFFKSWGSFFANIIHSFDYLFVQNQTSGKLLESIKYKKFSVVGDTRFDRVIDNAKVFDKIERIDQFIENKKVFVVGSAWKEDMEVLIPFIHEHSDMKFIIAPHELHIEEMNKWKLDLKAHLYSDYKANSDIFTNVLIIDSIGLLSKLYQYANYAFIGGGYGKGLHNTLEAAVFGVPIFFGDKSFLKFQEALDLIAIGVAFQVSDAESLRKNFNLLDSSKIVGIKNESLAYVNKQSGATKDIINFLAKY